MELSQLKYFLKLSEVLNFTEASKRLFITQSALSSSIRQLEEELGARLFDRVGKRVYLTESGRILAGHAREALASIAEGVQEVEMLHRHYRGTLEVGVTFTTSPMVGGCVAAFMKKYPDIKLRIHMCSSVNDAVEKVNGNQLDLAVTYYPEHMPGNIECLRLAEASLAVIVGEKHPLAEHSAVLAEELTWYPMVSFFEGMRTRRDADRLLRANGIAIEPRIEVDDVNIVLSMVKGGEWFSILSPLTILARPGFKAVQIIGQKEILSVNAMWLKGKSKNSLYQLFLAELVASLRE